MPAPNFPTPPQKKFDQQCFPGDLLQSNRRFCTNLTFMEYEASQQFSAGANMGFGGQYKLPLPKQLSDIESIVWGENDGLQTGIDILSSLTRGGFGNLATGVGAAKDAASAASGLQINPFYFMVYKRPAYKEFRFTWTLAPSSEQESSTLKKIIIEMKKAALPSSGPAFGLMKYPKIAMISFEPKEYLFALKPCAIQSVQVEYAPAGPSFFKSGAPTMVNLGLSLKEIQLWKSEDL